MFKYDVLAHKCETRRKTVCCTYVSDKKCFIFTAVHVPFFWWKEDKIEPLSWAGYSLFTGTIVMTAIQHN